ncbi:protein huluwa-like [Anolis sagrei]|uniref:protein huluwa-like n=1 Tax=Anolis sagrei TaxID=38937 RepID=UPI0035223E8F
MEPWLGVQEQLEALGRSLRSLMALILSCLFLILLLSCSFLLGWKPRPRGAHSSVFRRGSPLSPRLLQVVQHKTGNGATTKQALQPSRGGSSAYPLAPSCCMTHGCREKTPRARTHLGNPALLKRHGQGTVASSSDLALVPPNSPVTTSGTGGLPDGAFAGSCFTSTQEKVRAPAAFSSDRVPFEYSSSIRGEGTSRAPLTSGNFTATPGPGLDTDFGASAGISVRILSSDGDGSPDTSLFPRRLSGRFEWDYYDPSFERKGQTHPQPPPISSKQYWL